MKEPTAISRRINSSWVHFSKGEHEEALIDFFPALDKTAKRRRPKLGVGARIKEFLTDEEGLISALAINMYITNNRFGEYTFPEAIYKLGRTSIAHEGELDEKLRFDNMSGMEIGDTWNLPPSYISALIISVMIAPENRNESIDLPTSITIHGTNLPINALWGAKDMVRYIICTIFKDPKLFEN